MRRVEIVRGVANAETTSWLDVTFGFKEIVAVLMVVVVIIGLVVLLVKAVRSVIVMIKGLVLPGVISSCE